MDDTWWPDLLKHVAQEDPWADSMVTVAEMRSFDGPIDGQRYSSTALIAPADLERLNGNLSSFGFDVNVNGPHPFEREAGRYRPEFWIEAWIEEECLKLEPLVLNWESHNRTALVLDPGFAMTYGLIPRAAADGSIHWDDPMEPEYDVAIVDPPALFEAPRLTPTRARVSRDHLQDYLTLRDRVLVQVYMEVRSGREGDEIAAVLGEDQDLDLVYRDRTIILSRKPDGTCTSQVRGARVLARPGALPVTSSALDTNGLTWPGITGELTTQNAGRLHEADATVYVRDAVLGAYEGKPDFKINAEHGSVSHRAEWSLDHVTRIGRDLLQLDVRKLYEDVPPRTVRHWHGFAVEPPRPGDLAILQRVPNVATRTRDLTEALLGLGKRLAALAKVLGLEDLEAHDFVGVEPAEHRWSGWWNAPIIEAIADHIPLDLTQADFLRRCLDLDEVIVGALGEAALRRLVNAIGPQSDTNRFPSLELLDRLLCLADIARAEGLPPATARREILERFQTRGSTSTAPIMRLYALSDLRHVASHRKALEAVPAALERLHLALADTTTGWGSTLDGVYDAAIMELRSARSLLEQICFT